ncbi:hypothetical protein SAMN04515695_0673 [Pseudovibrio sp. Tun.PSC04-5.I4]|nr:hypothetical protein SAMN04515695_0673 [Pseudovibrio sp. Tun.PSC04-5.I4]
MNASPKNNRSVMASRVELNGQGDYFPTPPWATRVLCELILRLEKVGEEEWQKLSVWEPACGGGHMVLPLRDYFDNVIASDLFNRGFGDAHGEAWDFLTILPKWQFPLRAFDWIITNPPFGLLAQQFVERALAHKPKRGVAVLMPLRWLETIDRVATLFMEQPPDTVAVFAERVAIHKGHYDPKGGTATAYCWIIWRTEQATSSTKLVWIPPNSKKRFSKLSDLKLASAPQVVAEQPGPLFSLPETLEVCNA